MCECLLSILVISFGVRYSQLQQQTEGWFDVSDLCGPHNDLAHCALMLCGPRSLREWLRGTALFDARAAQYMPNKKGIEQMFISILLSWLILLFSYFTCVSCGVKLMQTCGSSFIHYLFLFIYFILFHFIIFAHCALSLCGRGPCVNGCAGAALFEQRRHAPRSSFYFLFLLSLLIVPWCLWLELFAWMAAQALRKHLLGISNPWQNVCMLFLSHLLLLCGGVHLGTNFLNPSLSDLCF